MELLNRQVESSASIYNDLHSLDRIRQQAKSDQRSAIEAAAKEFEAFFMNMMLKSMRQASEVIGEDSMFGSQQEKMFVGMLDEQLSVDLSQKGNLGIAELLTRDLLGENSKVDSNTIVSNLLSKTNLATEKNDSTDIVLNHSKIASEPINVAAQATTQPDTIGVEQKNYLAKLNDSKDLQSVNLKNTIGETSESFAVTQGVKTETSEQVDISVLAEKKSLFENAENFISQLLPTAEKIAKNLGVDPKLLLAQAALETGWGQYIMHDQTGKPSYNLFGIKGSSDWQGESLKADTLEVEQGTFVKRQQHFRMYESFEQSFIDYVNFVKSSPRYQQAVEAVDSAKDYIKTLQKSGYATDPNYAEKIINIYENGILKSPILK